MKKIVTLALGLLTAGAAWAQVDEITSANLMAQDPTIQVSTDYTKDPKPFTTTYTGESEAKYVITNGIIAEGMWHINDNGSLRTIESPGYIYSIKLLDVYWGSSALKVYVSEEPLTADNYRDATMVYFDVTSGSGPFYYNQEWFADKNYKYIYFDESNERIKGMEIEYQDDPIYTETKCETPIIDVKNSMYETVAGTEVEISTATSNALLNIDVYVQAVNTTEFVKSESMSKAGVASPYTLKLEGNPGDGIRIEATATRQGLEDSDKAETTVYLRIPKAAKPEFEGNPTFVYPGQVLKLVTATEGAQISYEYSISLWSGEDPDAVTVDTTVGDSPVTIVIPETAKEGQYFTISAKVIGKDNEYRDSDQLWIDLEVKAKPVDVKLDAPTFSVENGTEVESGTEVIINMPANATTLHYTINGGEEQTSNTNVTLTITADTNVEAWATGAEGFHESDKVTASYTVKTTGIDSITTDDSEAIYFNLQGVRVANPERGIYVKVQGGKSQLVRK